MRHILLNTMTSVMCFTLWMKLGEPLLLFVSGLGTGTVLAMVFALVAIRKGGE